MKRISVPIRFRISLSDSFSFLPCRFVSLRGRDSIRAILPGMSFDSIPMRGAQAFAPFLRDSIGSIESDIHSNGERAPVQPFAFCYLEVSKMRHLFTAIFSVAMIVTAIIFNEPTVTGLTPVLGFAAASTSDPESETETESEGGKQGRKAITSSAALEEVVAGRVQVILDALDSISEYARGRWFKGNKKVSLESIGGKPRACVLGDPIKIGKGKNQIETTFAKQVLLTLRNAIENSPGNDDNDEPLPSFAEVMENAPTSKTLSDQPAASGGTDTMSRIMGARS